MLSENIRLLTVLIDQHAYADAAHVEAVEEVLNGQLHRRIDVARLLQLDDALRHRLNDVLVSLPNVIDLRTESVRKSAFRLGHSTAISRLSTYCSTVLGVGSSFSYLSTSWKLCSYQLVTKPTEGVRRRLSGSRAISFMMLASRTGSSLRRKTNDFFSHGDRPAHNTTQMT